MSDWHLIQLTHHAAYVGSTQHMCVALKLDHCMLDLDLRRCHNSRHWLTQSNNIRNHGIRQRCIESPTVVTDQTLWGWGNAFLYLQAPSSEPRWKKWDLFPINSPPEIISHLLRYCLCNQPYYPYHQQRLIPFVNDDNNARWHKQQQLWDGYGMRGDYCQFSSISDITLFLLG